MVQRLVRMFLRRQRVPATLRGALHRVRLHAPNIQTLISLGAGSGADTAYIRRQIGIPYVGCIEAQDCHRAALERRSSSTFRYEIAAAGEANGRARFDSSTPTGGTLSDCGADVPMTTVDSFVSRRGLRGPFFLKFDTHGSEVGILRGAINTLKHTDLIMMEVYNFKLSFTGGRNLTFDEMCLHMRSHGFRVADLCNPLFRPSDGVLWQMHLFFLRSDSSVFGSNSYSG